MSTNLARAAQPRQSEPIDPDIPPRSTRVDLQEMRTWISRAIDEAGWNREAVAAAMGKDAAYVSRVLSGEKPLSASFIRELPDDVEAIVARYHAESFGHVVVAPVQGADAVRNFVAGLMGMLAPQLPTKARAVKASLRRGGE